MSVNASALIVLVCYVILLSLRVPIGINRHVSFGAAFAPLLAIVEPGRGLHRLPLVIGAAFAGAMIGKVLGRSITDIALEMVALLGSFGMVRSAYVLGHSTFGRNPLFEVGIAGLGVSAFSLVEWLGGRRSSGRSPAVDNRVWLVLQALLLSACGLTVLVYEQIGPAALGAILIPLVLTKREFDRYALAQATHDQTVAVLRRLEAKSL